MKKKLTLALYDIAGKTEQEVRCEVYDRLLRFIQQSGKWTTKEVMANIGQDTLFDVVADTYCVYVDEGALAAEKHIEKSVHELFVNQKGE